MSLYNFVTHPREFAALPPISKVPELTLETDKHLREAGLCFPDFLLWWLLSNLKETEGLGGVWVR